MDDEPVKTASAPASASLRVASVALRVRNLPRVAAFYRDVIGLVDTGEADGRVGLGVGGDTLVELLADAGAAADDPAGAGLFHTAFLLPSRADLGRWLEARARDGTPLDGAADHLVSDAVYLRDPENNGVEVYADRPRDLWRWTGGPGHRRVEMANRPLDFDGIRREAASVPEWTGAPAGTRIGHVHLRVGDSAEACRFYTAALGLDVTASWPGATFMSTGGYHHHIAVNSWRSAGAGARDPGRAGLHEVTLASVGGASAAGEWRDPWGTRLRVRRGSHPDG